MTKLFAIILLKVLKQYDEEQTKNRTKQDKVKLVMQGVVGIWLIIALALHLAAVGLIGLTVIILATSFTGVTEEHQIGHAFEEALPFTGLLVVFFVIVAMIHDQHLFKPIIDWALQQDPASQPGLFYIANGFLSAISDNVFVATVYIGEVESAFKNGVITREHFEKLAIAINTGTGVLPEYRGKRITKSIYDFISVQ